MPLRHRHQDFVEIPGANEGLVLDSFVAVALLHFEFLNLQARVSTHAFFIVSLSQLEHAGVRGVEASQGHELEFLAHLGQGFLERGDGPVIQVTTPIE